MPRAEARRRPFSPLSSGCVSVDSSSLVACRSDAQRNTAASSEHLHLRGMDWIQSDIAIPLSPPRPILIRACCNTPNPRSNHLELPLSTTFTTLRRWEPNSSSPSSWRCSSCSSPCASGRPLQLHSTGLLSGEQVLLLTCPQTVC